MKKIFLLSTIAGLFLSFSAKADVSLPYLLSDNMVIQRNVPVKIWGWAHPGEKVTVIFHDQQKKTTTTKDGKWLITLGEMKEGGPFAMTIKGKNEITLNNILIGDVWVCSGQSNMEWPLNNTEDAEATIAKAENPNIRLFTVQNKMADVPQENTPEASWQPCNANTVKDFSAVGYYFGKKVNENQQIPIGLISSNWGGTIVETWTDLETMYQFPAYKEKLEELKSPEISHKISNAEAKQKEWENNLVTSDTGTIEKWHLPGTKYDTWQEMKIPGLWDDILPNVDGIVWYQTEFELTEKQAKNSALLSVGKIDDGDKTYVNGQLVGETNDYKALRNYEVPAATLKPGKNILTIRVLDTGWGGGFYGSEDEYYIKTSDKKISLAGNWKYKTGMAQTAPRMAFSPNSYPTLLYNGMIHPLVNYGITGAIWYQGESNSGNAYEYRNLLAAMIKNWRSTWGLGDFPFIQVQLANYIANADEDWPLLRESQSEVCNMLPNVGMASAIDIGNPEDIHPRNKKDVGYRLANVAEKLAYGKDVIISGPQYKSHKVDGDKLMVEFNNCGDGLKVCSKYGYVNGFEIAGEDGEYHWARGYIKDCSVVLASDKVAKPVKVRYAWHMNPEDVNLYNSVKLPAEPFRVE